jgi:hypothetical protein
MTDLTKSILAIKSDAQVSVDSEDITKITWHDDNPTNITNEQILAKQIELITEYDAQDYARKRKAEYPDIYDYMDGVVKNDQVQIDKYIADCQAVKSKYLKE